MGKERAFQAAMMQFYHDYPTRGPVPAADLLAEDLVFESCGDKTQIPWAGTWHGVAGLQDFLDTVWEHVEITRYDVVSSVTDDFGALFLSELDVRHRRSGAVMTLMKADSISVRGDKVMRYREVYDVQAFSDWFHLQ
ncbi:MAG: nuclear transport factor 2 family protein [Alphaproteobacteria bacterium]